MKKRFLSIAVIIFCLTAACTLIRSNTEANTADNQQPANQQTNDPGNATASGAELPKHIGTPFRGSVGDSRVEMDIKHEGDALTGSYYYLRSGAGNRLNLSGKIDKNGDFTMQETDAAGKQTGTFQGKWKTDPNEPGASLEGTWLKPGQKGDGLGFFAFEQMVYFTTTDITTREFKENIKPKKATVSAEYPELSGNANAAGFNQLAKSRVMSRVAEFKKDISGMTAADLKMFDGVYIDLGYDVEYADEDLISVSFAESTFEGGAHPNQDIFTLTYDLKSGREVKLADLFKPGSKYLEMIADFATHDLQGRKDPDSGENRGLATDIFEDGAKPTADNYRNWNITKKGLLFSFPPYQVASYADGPQYVIVPYAHLKDIARPDGPLSKAKK